MPLDKRGAEEKSLRNASGESFPPEKIRLFRGVRVKDGDEKTHGLRFDPLAPMDITSTVVVMPDQATPVWAIFDTSGVTPGRYSGVIRVIPLGQAVTMKNKRVVKTSTSDLPFELEVLPFELSRTPALPQFYFGSAYGNREIFRMMLDYGLNVPLINTWGFNVRYQPDGSVRECRTSGPEREIRRILEWAQEAGMEKDIQIGVAYSAYKIFCDIHAKKQFKFGTPEWEKAWRGHIRAIEEVRKKCGVPNDRFFVELWDEPHAKDMQEVLRSVKIAHETAPEMNFMITFASWEIPPGELEKLIPYLSHWCFWSTKYFTDKKYAPLLSRLRAEGKNISFYTCETTMRLDLQKYYLTHPWRALACNLDMCNLYQFLTHWYATNDWTRSAVGNVALIASGHPVSTIRLENLRIGSTDLKYMAKLAEVLKQSDTQDKTLRAEAERFLKETPERVGITRAHDPSARAEAREKAIDLILKLTGRKEK